MATGNIFQVLYTQQKNKKSKVWHDGTLKIDDTLQKAKLYDDKQTYLDTIFVKHAEIQVGETFETDRYLITVESAGDIVPAKTLPLPAARAVVDVPMSRSVGMKRQNTGFIPPRVMKISRCDVPDDSVKSYIGRRVNTYPDGRNDLTPPHRSSHSSVVESWPSPDNLLIKGIRTSDGHHNSTLAFDHTSLLGSGDSPLWSHCSDNKPFDQSLWLHTVDEKSKDPSLWSHHKIDRKTSDCKVWSQGSGKKHDGRVWSYHAEAGPLSSHHVKEHWDEGENSRPMNNMQLMSKQAVAFGDDFRQAKRNALQIIGLINKNTSSATGSTDAGLIRKHTGAMSSPNDSELIGKNAGRVCCRNDWVDSEVMLKETKKKSSEPSFDLLSDFLDFDSADSASDEETREIQLSTPGSGSIPISTPGSGAMPISTLDGGSMPIPTPGSGSMPILTSGGGSMLISTPCGGSMPISTQGNGSMPISTLDGGSIPISTPGSGSMPISTLYDGSMPIPTPGSGSMLISTPCGGSMPISTQSSGSMPISTPGGGTKDPTYMLSILTPSDCSEEIARVLPISMPKQYSNEAVQVLSISKQNNYPVRGAKVSNTVRRRWCESFNQNPYAVFSSCEQFRSGLLSTSCDSTPSSCHREECVTPFDRRSSNKSWCAKTSASTDFPSDGLNYMMDQELENESCDESSVTQNATAPAFFGKCQPGIDPDRSFPVEIWPQKSFSFTHSLSSELDASTALKDLSRNFKSDLSEEELLISPVKRCASQFSSPVPIRTDGSCHRSFGKSKWDAYVDELSKGSPESSSIGCTVSSPLDGVDHLFPVFPVLEDTSQADSQHAAVMKYTVNSQNDDDLSQSSGVDLCNISYSNREASTAEITNSLRPLHRPFLPPFAVHVEGSSLHSSSRLLRGDLVFPERGDVENSDVPSRKISIPISFTDIAEYKRIFNVALKEHLNIQLFQLSKLYHEVMKSSDLSQYSPLRCSSVGSLLKTSNSESTNPRCSGHDLPSKIVQVKKDGPNKGRYFFTCSAARDQQCRFFCWAEDSQIPSAVCLTNAKDIESLATRRDIPLYCECYFYSRRIQKFQQARQFNVEMNVEKKLYLKLSRKMKSSDYTKDDLWIISETLDFESRRTFLARSTFYGPMANAEVEIEPMTGFCPSDWPNNKLCYALHAGNAQTELSCLLNLNSHVTCSSMPILPYILNRYGDIGGSAQRRKDSLVRPMQNENRLLSIAPDLVAKIAGDLIAKYNLNCDQAAALHSVANMFGEKTAECSVFSLVHGVFGSGKSFLLAVIVLFIVTVLDMERQSTGILRSILIASLTNVAVDRVLSGLLELNFKDFVRVGSAKKIAPSIIPYSVIQKNADLMNTDLSTMLKKAKVVGATCAACNFSCMTSLSFPVVLLDECSQMTEPASLLPVARFNCQRLVLLGDPHQLDPTLQGSEASGNEDGLEQTLFDRLLHMGHEAIMLRTQYRCHPVISGLANQLFYGNCLRNGIESGQRLPLAIGWPTLCFYDVAMGCEASDSSNSFFNNKEAEFVGFLIDRLIQDGVEAKSIGVVALYRAQQSKIADILTSVSCKSKDLLKSIQISTVDAFQGAERDVIILSCVRTRNVGFIDCDKRVNVALTRARHHLFIIGHYGNLEANVLWKRVISYCQELPDGFVNSAKLLQKYSISR